MAEDLPELANEQLSAFVAIPDFLIAATALGSILYPQITTALPGAGVVVDMYINMIIGEFIAVCLSFLVWWGYLILSGMSSSDMRKEAFGLLCTGFVLLGIPALILSTFFGGFVVLFVAYSLAGRVYMVWHFRKKPEIVEAFGVVSGAGLPIAFMSSWPGILFGLPISIVIYFTCMGLIKLAANLGYMTVDAKTK